MIYKDAITKMRMLINEYSIRGEVLSVDASNVMDDSLKFCHYLDTAQKAIANIVPIKDSMTRTLLNENYIVTDTLQGYTSAEYLGKLIYLTTLNKLYRIEYVGSQYVATPLNDTLVPLTWRYEIQMPSNFYKLLKVRIYKDGIERTIQTDWKEPNTLLIDKCISGILRIEYSKVPTTITNPTDNTTFEIRESAQMAMVYYAAALVLQLQNTTAYYQLMQLYEEMMINIETNENARQHKIIKV